MHQQCLPRVPSRVHSRWLLLLLLLSLHVLLQLRQRVPLQPLQQQQ
jgi:hypothetical protein